MLRKSFGCCFATGAWAVQSSAANFRLDPYIADFVCLRHKLIVEADGGQHADPRADAVRDRWLRREGYTVIRYGNLDILKNPEGVLTDLWSRLPRQGH
jgi:very-short-patch-repair endonuclease